MIACTRFIIRRKQAIHDVEDLKKLLHDAKSVKNLLEDTDHIQAIVDEIYEWIATYKSMIASLQKVVRH